MLRESEAARSESRAARGELVPGRTKSVTITKGSKELVCTQVKK